MPQHRTRPRAACAAVLAAALLALAVPAAAGAPMLPDLDRARAAAAAPQAISTVEAFLAADHARSATGSGGPPAARAPDPGADGPARAPRLGATVAVHTLDPDFVRGLPGTVPARVEGAATTATGATGRTATIRTAPTPAGDGWQVVSIGSGDEEERHARAAGPDRTAFREPQTNTWYAWNGELVEPLHAEAARVLGVPALSTAAYQRHVAARYADRLPGTPYDAAGLAGGDAPTAGGGDPAPALPLALAALTGLTLTAAGLAGTRRGGARARGDRPRAPRWAADRPRALWPSSEGLVPAGPSAGMQTAGGAYRGRRGRGRHLPHRRGAPPCLLT
ncbi:hypothetical protein [Streptomyces sp. NPDC051577]|uniref:hypothetical protein n=1 Tax=Streptomyces sp. NPDC051577 TaxID=3155166 RepID=UPI003428A306